MGNEVFHWHKTAEKLGGFKAIRHRITKELNLAGKRGEVWSYGPGTYRAVVLTTKTQNRVLKLLNLPGVGENKSELLVTFQEELLPDVLKLIKYTSQQTRQIRLATQFSRRG